LTALEANSGVPGKVARITGAPGDYYASPVVAEDNIYSLSAEGKLAVIKPGLRWDVLAVNDLGEECFATPAIGKTGLYVRTSKYIVPLRELMSHGMHFMHLRRRSRDLAIDWPR